MTPKPPPRTKATKPINRRADFEKALNKERDATYVLKLFVTGSTPRSLRAIDNIKKICNDRLKGRYRLEVVDVYQQPELAAREQLLVVPTLIKKLPLPLRTFIGDLSQTDKLLVGLDLLPPKR